MVEDRFGFIDWHPAHSERFYQCAPPKTLEPDNGLPIFFVLEDEKISLALQISYRGSEDVDTIELSRLPIPVNFYSRAQRFQQQKICLEVQMTVGIW